MAPRAPARILRASLPVLAGAAAGMSAALLVSSAKTPPPLRDAARETSTLPEPGTPVEARHAVESLLASAAQRHEAEPRDEAWSERARTALDTDLAQLAKERPFAVDAIDCRSRSCIATLTWKSFPEAAATSSSLLHRRYGLNCARLVMMPEPEDPSRPYTSKVVFECQSPDTAMESG